MKKYLFGAALLSVTVALAAWATEVTVTDFSDWLAGQPQSQQRQLDDRDLRDRGQERRAVRERIAAVREKRGKVEAFARSGRWKSQRGHVDDRQPQPWHVQIERNKEDGSITGTIAVIGSGELGQGKIEGWMSGDTAVGVITNGAGNQLATFTGSASGNTISGSYETNGSDHGTWSYED